MLGFRVWDVKNKKMIKRPTKFRLSWKGELYSYYKIKILTNNQKYYNTEFKPTQKVFIPMQSIGMNDSLGKEIFELDIILITDDIYKTSVVKIVKNAPIFLLDEAHANFRCHIEVIGNKFEHPELLEKA